MSHHILASSFVDRVINNQYQLVEELGRGSYGCTFLGQSLPESRYIAVKVLSKMGLDPDQLALQQLEIDIQSQLQHPNLLALHQTVHEKDQVYLVMELCDQGDLFDHIVHEPLSEDEVKTFFGQVLDAVEYMHEQSVYHRDIKLENILLQEKNDQLVCKLADFGLATRDRYSMEFGCGSTTYLGPEHFASDQDTDEFEPYDAAASDVWSLGILLLALLFGRNPWEEATSIDPSFASYLSKPNLQDLFPTLSRGSLNLLESVLAIEPTNRPSITQLKSRFATLEQLLVTPLVPVPPHKASYDSAVFSQSSWSEEDDDSTEFDIEEEDDTMFVHTQEKESWWL
jgi:serine/threonine protein kinase